MMYKFLTIFLLGSSCFKDNTVAATLACGHAPEHEGVYDSKVSFQLHHASIDGVIPPRYSRELIMVLDKLPKEDTEYFEAEGRVHEWNYVLDRPKEILSWL